MHQTIFDVFRGAGVSDATWMGIVEGLSNARQRIEELAAATPGQYFVFDPQNNSVVARIDNRKVLTWPQQKAKSA